MLVCWVFGFGLLPGIGAPPAHALVTPPDQYAAATIVVGLDDARDIVATPDGRILVALGTGEIRVIKDDALLPNPMLKIPVGIGGNKGLHTLALDSGFMQNGYIYIVYTPAGTDFNRLSRFTVAGNTADPTSEVRIVDLPPLDGAPSHYGGAVVDLGDGTLLVTVGDHERAANGQNLGTLTGKALRINKDGSIPPDNPYVGNGTIDGRIYAYGFRNPWQVAKSSTGQVVVSDVGSSLWEEANVLSAGANYGWAAAEGAGGIGVQPLFTYPHFGLVPGSEFEGCAITGGTFYEPDTVQLPTRYVGKLFVGDLCGGWIAAVDPSTGVAEKFATGFGSLADLATNPVNGALYALDRSLIDNRSGIIKIEYVGQNASLRITSQPTSQRLAIGQRASFFVGAIGQGELHYQWQRNGIDIPGANAAAYVIDSVTSSDDSAQLRAIVTDDLGEVRSSIAEIIVTDNHAPEPFISEPREGQTYAGGDRLVLTGGATDLENGVLDRAALTWEVRFNHGGHDHGFTGKIVGTDNVTVTIPRSGETSDDVWYTVYLTAQDPDGASATVVRVIEPRRVALTFDTSPSGGLLNIDGPPHVSPHLVIGVEGVFRDIGAPRVQVLEGKPQGFVGWSDGGVREHTYTTPATNAKVTASYAPLPFGEGTSPQCKVAPMDDAAAITFSGSLGSSLNLLRNGRWIQTVTGFDYYVDGDSPSPNATYSIRVRGSGGTVDYGCSTVQWPPGGPPPPPPSTDTVPMVVGDQNALIASEVAVRNRLTNAGYSVKVIDDNVVTAADANGAAFVFVSSTVNGNVVGSKLRNVPQSVWMAKPSLLDDMLMTGPVADVDYGAVTSASIVITDAAHPLAAGRSGTVTVTTSSHAKSFGLPGLAADVVATASGRPTTFVYHAGDQLVGGSTAAGCRLTSSAFQNGPANFTAAGWVLFDAVADYAASNCQAGPAPDGAPTVDVTAPADGAVVAGVVSLTASANDAEGIQQVEFFVNGTSVGVDTSGGDGWGLTWDSTTATDGAATVRATVTDTVGQTASDQVGVSIVNSILDTVPMVVGDPNALIASEVAVRNRLTNAGFSVTVIDDNAVQATDANGAAFVFVSSTVNGNVVGTKLRNVPQTVWMAKPSLLDDMLMTGPVADVDYGAVTSASIVITDAAHPLAAGQSGTVTVTTSSHAKSFGVPGPAAEVVATASGKATTFVYQAGDQLVGGSMAAGCRLTSSTFQNGPAHFTAAGWSLFDAAADYAASNCQA